MLTWEYALPRLIAIIRYGHPKGRSKAYAQLLKMAKRADLQEKQIKKKQKKSKATLQ